MSKKIEKEREKIRKIASEVLMRYDDGDQFVLIGEDWVKQAPGVYSILCSLYGEDCTVINVVFSEGGLLKPHHHDRREFVFVASGSIVEIVSNRVLNEGESMIIEENQSHGWKSDGAKLTVVWKPPYPNV